MEEPFFSVITPSWNQGKFLRGCIGSVVNQNDRDFEHLIFDNCSTDGTAEIVAEFPHVRFVSEPDRGQAHAVNKGFLSASGEILCWLNSDDEYAPGAFAALREAFSDPAVQVVFGDVRQISYGGQGEVIACGKFESRLDLIRWWGSDVKLHQPAVFFRRDVVTSAGQLREDLHYALDYEYWWRISERFRFHYIPQVLAIQHRQPDSKTIRDWAKVLEERERIFSPFYDLIDAGRPAALDTERRKCLARQYLALAWAARDSVCARKNLLSAWQQSPALVLRPANLGLIRRILS